MADRGHLQSDGAQSSVDAILQQLEEWAADVDESTFLFWAQASFDGAAGGALAGPHNGGSANAGGDGSHAQLVERAQRSMLQLHQILSPDLTGGEAWSPRAERRRRGGLNDGGDEVMESAGGSPPKGTMDGIDTIEQIHWMKDQKQHWLGTQHGDGLGEGRGAQPQPAPSTAGEQLQQQQQQQRPPRAQGLTPEERLARRRRSLAESNKRYQARRKGMMDELQQQLADRQQQLTYLAYQNLALRAKMTSLSALVADREINLQTALGRGATPGGAGFEDAAGPLGSGGLGGGGGFGAAPGLERAAPPSPPFVEAAAQLRAALGAVSARHAAAGAAVERYASLISALPGPDQLAREGASGAAERLRHVHTAFVAAAGVLLPLAAPDGAAAAAATAAGQGEGPEGEAFHVIAAVAKTHMSTMRAMAQALGPAWWNVAECRMDTGEHSPAPVEHWVSFLAARQAALARFKIGLGRDRELLAVVMMFTESMHKLLLSRERLMRHLVTTLTATGDAPVAQLPHSGALGRQRLQGDASLGAGAGAAAAAAAASRAQDLWEQWRRRQQPQEGGGPAGQVWEMVAQGSAQAQRQGGDEGCGDEPSILDDRFCEIQETLDDLAQNIRQQSNLLASLHGASALIAQRTPLLLAQNFVLNYPYLPDMVKTVQVSGRIYLPPIFLKSGIGLSAEDVDRGATALAEELRRMAQATGDA
ncbi:hypothetical protein MNEG_6849 [Monoraphidium neglectum]|uniref:BZIP domain-containing protein n=1 Tax=Monoraphidium neglectum TaxID=145388 RepID=A0A0D2N567_9CHLO|nr:hypothetical protein MNEG_6849 [Monoraphidium neglectum]KIZ01111.1 hypothetical protein MNEG_6849 [Monoraphidium neglectum]|eukprot:XP_013900130.1 hypothetical protein MNEG_6849 [Monoraphidium neglectum]